MPDVIDCYNAMRKQLDPDDRTSSFEGLPPDLQLLWRVVIIAMYESNDAKRSIGDVLKALAVPDDLEAAIKEDERVAKVRAKYPNATNQSIG